MLSILTEKINNYLFNDGIKETWQNDWDKTCPCHYCHKTAYLFLVSTDDPPFEKNEKQFWKKPKYIKDAKIWPHDRMTIANYFCPNCGEITTKWNQA